MRTELFCFNTGFRGGSANGEPYKENTLNNHDNLCNRKILNLSYVVHQSSQSYAQQMLYTT